MSFRFQTGYAAVEGRRVSRPRPEPCVFRTSASFTWIDILPQDFEKFFASRSHELTLRARL
jgi:hypothetical protein